MNKIGLCPKCGSSKIIQEIIVYSKDRWEGGQRLQAIILKFKAQRTTGKRTLGIFPSSESVASSRRPKAWICGECGYTEFYIDKPQSFHSKYQEFEKMLKEGGEQIR